MEIARCLKLQRQIQNVVELFLQAAVEYNRTFHSVTGMKPIEVIHASLHIFPDIAARLQKAQQEQLERSNAYRPVRSNKRLGDKVTPLYFEERIDADLGTTVLIKGTRPSSHF